jgi:hypothetical protein
MSYEIKLNNKFWKELFVCFLLKRHDHTENDTSNNYFCRGNVFTELLHSNDKGTHRQTHSHTRPTILLVACMPCRGNVFTVPLPSNDRRNTHTDTRIGDRVYEVRR